MNGRFLLFSLILLVFLTPLAGALVPDDELYPANDLYPSEIPDVAFTISANHTTITESDTQILITITKNQAGDDINSTVEINTTDGSAIAGQDYTAISKNLTFAQNQTSQTVILSIKDNKQGSFPKTFKVALSNPTGNATLGTPSEVTITINGINGLFETDNAAKGMNMTLLLFVMIGLFVILYLLGNLLVMVKSGFDPAIFALIISGGIVLGVMIIAFVVLTYMNGEIYNALAAFT